MNKNEFKELLKKANLSKKALSEILKIPYATANSWGNNGSDYPYWLEHWLTLYIENQKYKQLKELCQSIDSQ